MIGNEDSSAPEPGERAQLYDILSRSGFNGRDAYILIQIVEEMASANLIHRFEAKLDALRAEMALQKTEMTAQQTEMTAQQTEMAAQLGAQKAEMAAQLGTQKAEMAAQLGTQRTEMAAQLGAQKTEMAAQLGAQNVQLRFIKWGIGIILGIIAALGVTVSILTALPG